MENRDNSLTYSIIIAAVLIAGALGFAGYQISTVNKQASTEDVNIDEKVQQGVEDYIAKQKEEEQKAIEEANKPQKVEDVSIDDDAVLGDPNAPVTIVEFSDYQCPFCGRHVAQVFPEIEKNYIDTGKVKYVFRDMPLTQLHSNAIELAIAAECAGDQDKYFEMHDKLFAHQDANSPEDIKKYANEIGLDLSAFNSCVENETPMDEIMADMADGEKYGVRGTPGFFINGWNLAGAYPYEDFEKLIEQELNK